MSTALFATVRGPVLRHVGAPTVVFVLLGTGLVLATVLSLATGATDVGFADLWRFLTGRTEQMGAQTRLVIEAIRLPRTALALLVGAGLGLAGALMQGLFRNPLADPAVVGVTSGAATAAVAAIVLGDGVLAPLAALLGQEYLPTLAFAGGLLNTALLYFFATRGQRTSTATLVLAGIAVGAFAAALTGILIFLADDNQLRDITFWSLGSLGGATAARVLSVAPFVLAAIIACPFLARGLDAMALGDAVAFHMGVDVQRVKKVVILSVAAAAGATVAVTGSIGFVGIVVPHVLRLAGGASHRFLLPASALGGALLLVTADMFARTVVAPAELPLGIITALIGAPVFLSMLLRRRPWEIAP
ncbi:Hemin transport system permease protein HmuU [uncultured Pleomorphomonas sp.]|uniref:Iron ABC transporter n=2 Tax=Pleomorphomonas TaxID=261933 RepID=A0A2G9X0N5_9HYPH|nr:iron ABC transporter [Pleomorphomonas carboxyditropha]SCM76289.1 Hemin transport system permease protein HmuU [uncultured Pleomorphomonas sp.]